MAVVPVNLRPQKSRKSNLAEIRLCPYGKLLRAGIHPSERASPWSRLSLQLTTIKAGLDRLGDCSIRTTIQAKGNHTMTSDIIAIWAGALGLAYLAAAGLYFEMRAARKRSHPSTSYGFGRHVRPHPVRIRRSR